MIIDKDELRRLAEASIIHGEKIGEDDWISEFELSDVCDREDARFIDAADPQTILALLDEIADLRNACSSVITGLDLLNKGCDRSGFVGWQNGDGEDCGAALQESIEELRKFLRDGE